MNDWNQHGAVVVEVDGSSEGLRAVEFACGEALRAGAELVLAAPYAIATTSYRLAPGALPSADLAHPGLAAAVDTIHRSGGSGLTLTVVAGEGPSSKLLSNIARQAGLVVVGAPDASGPLRHLLAQGDLALMARIDCPVVVVPRVWNAPSESSGLTVGVDGTELSAEALEFAFHAAATRHVPLTVVHAAAKIRRPADDGVGQLRADRVLAEVLAGWSVAYPEVDVRRRGTAESAVSALLEESRTAELLVLGARTEALAAFNPVARRVASASECPVVFVPHHATLAEREVAWRRQQPVAEIVHPTY